MYLVNPAETLGLEHIYFLVVSFRHFPRLAAEQYHWLDQCVEQLYFRPLGVYGRVPCFIQSSKCLSSYKLVTHSVIRKSGKLHCIIYRIYKITLLFRLDA